MAALMGLAGPNGTPDDAKPQKLKKLNKISGSCDVIRLRDGVRLHCRPYATDQGAMFFAANVFSISPES